MGRLAADKTLATKSGSGQRERTLNFFEIGLSELE